MRSNADLLALKAELTNDPTDIGLTTVPADDEANANALNLVRETVSVRRRSLSTATLFGAIDALEHQGLTDQQSRWLDAVLLLGQVDPFTAVNVVIGLNGLFGAETVSRAAIAPLLVQAGSRIDQLFQAGTLSAGGDVTPSDIANARNAT